MLRTATILLVSSSLLAACGSEPAPPAPQPTEATPAAAATPAPSGQPQASVTDAWVQLPAVPGRPAAAYFKLIGGEDDSDILLAVTSPATPRIEFHQTLVEGAVSRMEKFDVYALSRNEVAEFAPGAKHLMLFDLKPDIKPGQKIPLTFEFQSGQKVTVDAETRATGG